MDLMVKNVEENCCIHICLGWKTCKLLKCLSTVNCQIMESAAVNYRGNFKPFFFDKNHKLSLLIFIDFECFNHYFGTFQTIAILYLFIYILIRIAFKSV